MRFQAQKKELVRVLSRANSVADKKSTMPILSSCLVTAGKSSVEIRASDLSITIASDIAANVNVPGSCAISARDLLDRVRMMPDGAVEIAFSGPSVTITSPTTKRKFVLSAVPGAEFPAEPKAPPDSQTVPVAKLARMFGLTHFAISTDETRLHLSSLLFEFAKGKVSTVATDGHRLALATENVSELTAERNMLIPGKAIQELRRLCDDALADDPESGCDIMRSGDDVAFFELAGFTLSVRCPDAQFPPYQQVIPEKQKNETVVNRAEFADALRAVSLAASDRTGGVKVSVSGKSLTVATESPESGAGTDELSVQHTGDAVSVGVNAKYLLDILGAVSGQYVALCTEGDMDPVVVRLLDDESYLAVVMPMRV